MTMSRAKHERGRRGRRGLNLAAAVGVVAGAGALPLVPAGAATHRTATSTPVAGALLATLHPPTANPYNEYGTTVALSGETAVVGFPGSAYVRAAAYVYTEHLRHWALVSTLRHPASGSGGTFGGQVAIWGTTIAVAGGTGHSPQVFVFSKGAAGWPATPTAVLSDPGERNGFGSSVAVWGTTVVVGSDATESSTGGAYLYQETAAGWASTPTATLTEPPQGDSGFVQSSVAILGTTVVVGSSSDDQTSAVYVYDEGPAGWPTVPTTTLVDPSGPGDGFGGSVALSGSTLVVGAPFADSARGTTYLYAKGTGGWPAAPTATLANPSAASFLFGASVSISGSTVLIGLWGGGSAPGAAYIYSLGATGWPLTPTATLSDPSTTVNDLFADEVAVSGSVVIAGAPALRRADIPAAAYLFADGSNP